MLCYATADPLVYHGNTRARNAAEFLRVTEDIVRSMDTMDFPFIALHGDIDTLCDPDGSRQLFERSAVRHLLRSVPRCCPALHPAYEFQTVAAGLFAQVANTSCSAVGG